MGENTNLKNALRWLGFIPGALLAAFLTGAIMRLLYRSGPFNTEAFFGRLWVEIIASGLMGAAFVYSGARIAPTSRKTVGYILTVVAILIAGFASFPAILSGDLWALVDCLAVAGGAALVAYLMAEGELDLNTHKLF